MKVLVVVDMQNDFISGSLGSPEAEAIVPAVCKKIRYWDHDIFTTQDTHFDDYMDTQEGKNLPVVHCVKDTKGWQLHSDIQNELFLKKFYTPMEKSTFGCRALAGALQILDGREHIEEVQLVGVCTDICVISNAMLLKAFLPETTIIVDAACCAGVSPESHMRALQAMEVCQIKIINQ